MSAMIDSFFKALGEFFGWRKQAENPETIRLAKISEIDKQLEQERKKRDSNMAIPRTPENETGLAYSLGVIDDTIIELRKTRATLER